MAIRNKGAFMCYRRRKQGCEFVKSVSCWQSDWEGRYQEPRWFSKLHYSYNPLDALLLDEKSWQLTLAECGSKHVTRGNHFVRPALFMLDLSELTE